MVVYGYIMSSVLVQRVLSLTVVMHSGIGVQSPYNCDHSEDVSVYCLPKRNTSEGTFSLHHKILVYFVKQTMELSFSHITIYHQLHIIMEL